MATTVEQPGHIPTTLCEAEIPSGGLNQCVIQFIPKTQTFKIVLKFIYTGRYFDYIAVRSLIKKKNPKIRLRKLKI